MGAHWPGDVPGGYLFGVVRLTGAVALYSNWSRICGILAGQINEWLLASDEKLCCPANGRVYTVFS